MSVVVLNLVGKPSECSHIGGDVIGILLNHCPVSSPISGEPGLDLLLSGFTRVTYFPHEFSQVIKELIDLPILMLYPFPLNDIEVFAKEHAKTHSCEIKEAGPLAV
jgi:hypothetical protein